MNQIIIEVSDEVERDLARLAGSEGLSPQDYLSHRLPEVIRQQVRHKRMFGRVAAADPKALRSYLDAAPDVEPAPDDRLPRECVNLRRSGSGRSLPDLEIGACLRCGTPRRGPWGRRAEERDGPRSCQRANRRTSTGRFGCGLTKKCSAAGQTDDGLEPGEQCKPGNTAGSLQRLVRPHAADWRSCRLRERECSEPEATTSHAARRAGRTPKNGSRVRPADGSESERPTARLGAA